ncbi:NUDIX hydrolase [Streptomyces chrestomyceticus]|uniref:NUDIX hydrolase n=1 Tax=Streptomyces chrestomyceticus TaxID=68185 RepID=UPI0027DE0A66|nr:NUDIX domain-containing protein [Streptomyces chrestomyceticus]
MVEEIVALYAEGDLSGRVVGSAPRSRMRAENLPHCATQVLLRDPEGRVYVHRRTDTKDVYPGMHDAWAGGVVAAGEDPDETAEREVTEELGVRGCPVRPCFRYWFADDHANYLACVYVAEYDPDLHGPVVHQASEVAEGWWMTWEELTARLADPEWPFVPDGRAGLERYAQYLEEQSAARG